MDLPHRLAWSSKTGLAEENRNRLGRLRDRHRGERCFIMANGPSLAKVDHAKLKGETTFGLNRIYLMADLMRVPPTYYVCINELILDQFHHEIAQLTMPKFVNWNRRGYFIDTRQNAYFLRVRLGLRDAFWPNIKDPISSGGTVTYAALQIAYYMGFGQVIIVGLDHSYQTRGTPNRTTVRGAEQDLDHFDPDYFPKGTKWQPPDLLRSELAYALARQAYESASRQVVDATLGGKCDVFERSNLDELFERNGEGGW